MASLVFHGMSAENENEMSRSSREKSVGREAPPKSKEIPSYTAHQGFHQPISEQNASHAPTSQRINQRSIAPRIITRPPPRTGRPLGFIRGRTYSTQAPGSSTRGEKFIYPLSRDHSVLSLSLSFSLLSFRPATAIIIVPTTSEAIPQPHADFAHGPPTDTEGLALTGEVTRGLP